MSLKQEDSTEIPSHPASIVEAQDPIPSNISIPAPNPAPSTQLPPTTNAVQETTDDNSKEQALDSKDINPKQEPTSTTSEAITTLSKPIPVTRLPATLTPLRAATLRAASKSFVSSIFSFVQGAAKIRTSCQWSPGAGDEVHINSTSNFCKELGYYALNIPWEDLLWLLNAFNFVLKPISTSSSASVYHVNSVPQYILFHPTNGFRKDSTPIELCQIQIQKHKLVELESIGKEYLEDEKKMKETIQPILQPLPIPRSNSVAMDKGNSSGGRGRKEQAIRSIARDSVARDSIASTSGSEDGLKRKNAGDDDDDSPATKRRGRPPKAEGERKSSRSSASLVDYTEPGDREGLSWAELYAPEGYQPIIPVPTAETLATPSWRKPPPPTLPPKTKEEMETIPIPPWLDPTPRPTNAKPTNGTKSKASTSKASTSKSNQSRPISQSLNKGGKSDGTVISPASAAYKTAKLESPRCLSCKGKHQKCLPGKGGVVNGIKVGPCLSCQKSKRPCLYSPGRNKNKLNSSSPSTSGKKSFLKNVKNGNSSEFSTEDEDDVGSNASDGGVGAKKPVASRSGLSNQIGGVSRPSP